MKQTIHITGTIYEANAVQVNKDVAAKLVAGAETGSTPFRSMVRLQDQLFSESIVSGYLADAGQVTVTITGSKGVRSFSLQPTDSQSTLNAVPIGKDVVVTEKVTRDAVVMLKIESDFIQDRLEWIADELMLPTRACKVVMMPQYDGQDFEFVQSVTDSATTYLVTQEGDQINLLADD